jgi:predicted SAM-dependent methyltransferase
MKDQKNINIGCGDYFDSSWINLDITSNSAMVISHNILKGLPFQPYTFDTCYSSHVLEHLTQEQAKSLLIECLRVLKSNGIIRLVVPDLEAIARNYLSALERSLSGNVEHYADYDWMMLELFDQTVRDSSGGEMGKYLACSDLPNREFIRTRFGYEAENFWQKQREDLSKQSHLIEKLKSKKLGWLVQKLRLAIAKFFITIIAGKESAMAFDIGLFRNSGEVHQWMYDRFSLARLLKECGFVNIKICQAHESSIPDFNSYGLDIIDGKVRKPDSLFIEACKP